MPKNCDRQSNKGGYCICPKKWEEPQLYKYKASYILYLYMLVQMGFWWANLGQMGFQVNLSQ